MTSPIKFTIFLALTMLTLSFPAAAYMGPGAGITAVGCLLALGAGIWYTFKGFLWLPLKRLFKKTPNEDAQQAHLLPQEQASQEQASQEQASQEQTPHAPQEQAEQANHTK
jgi:hypothetical protein